MLLYSACCANILEASGNNRFEGVMKCRNCGAAAIEGASHCDFCGSGLVAADKIGTHQNVPHREAPEQEANVTGAKDSTSIKADARPVSLAYGLTEYYARAFEEFERSGDASLKPKFNIGAFFFGAFWYLYRGLWAKSLLYFAIVIGSGGIASLIPWIYGFMFGTYDLYLLRKTGKQLW